MEAKRTTTGGHGSSGSSSPLPFYAIAQQKRPRKKTSAEIISEAKAVIKGAMMGGVRPLDTQRPFTPKERDRVFFGRRNKLRPPSAFSLKYLQAEVEEMRLPAIKRLDHFRSACSLENLQEEGEPSAVVGNSGDNHQTSLFDNKRIIEHSDGLFDRKGFLSPPKDQVDSVTEHDRILDLLHRLNGLKEELSSVDQVTKLVRQLCKAVEKAYLVEPKLSSKLKVDILRCLYRFVESTDEELLLEIARVILTLRVTGTNLSGVCKLIFKVSRNDNNDVLFNKNNVIELFVDALSRCSPTEDAEACVYAYGSIKFLTMNSALLQKFLPLGILQLMVLHVKLINCTKLDRAPLPEQTSHALYQLTGALRNLASEESLLGGFVSSGAVAELCKTLRLFSADVDIIGNISRTLSIISTNDECGAAIAETADIYRTLVVIFEKYPGKQEVIVRLGYTLGNLVANFDSSRLMFYQEKNSVDCLIDVLNIYINKESDSKDDSANDVLVKTMRIIANIAINQEVGRSLIECHGLRILDVFLIILPRVTVESNEELVHSILSTLNNLSYYYSPDSATDVIHVKQLDIAKALLVFIDCSNKECTIEAISVLGNLSRSKVTRDFLVEAGIFGSLTKTLEKGYCFLDDIELLRATVGVLVNLMSDWENRVIFKEHNGIHLLIQVLNEYGQLDWALSMFVCQVIWNFSVDASNLNAVFSESEMHQLMATLVDYLDEEKLFTHFEGDVFTNQEYLAWEEFANVGTNLLEKIENYLEKAAAAEEEADNGNDDDEDDDLCLPKKRDSSTNISFAAW